MALPVFPDAPNTKPEPSDPLTSQQCTPEHSDSLGLVNAFLTRHTFDLSSPSCQVDSRHPPSFLTQCLLTFTLLHQVYSRRLIGPATAVRQSPIAYLPRSMCLSLSFLALYISVRSSMSHHLLPFVCFLCLILSSPSPSTLVSSIFILISVDPTLVIPYIPYDPFLIVQIIPIITTPRTCINTLSTRCCSSV